MWANAQHDGRPAEYRWRAPSVQRRKVWLTPSTTVPCSNAAKTRNPLKFAGVPPNYRTGLSRYWAEVHHIVGTCGGDCCLTSFFPFSDCRYVP